MVPRCDDRETGLLDQPEQGGGQILAVGIVAGRAKHAIGATREVDNGLLSRRGWGLVARYSGAGLRRCAMRDDRHAGSHFAQHSTGGIEPITGRSGVEGRGRAQPEPHRICRCLEMVPGHGGDLGTERALITSADGLR